MSANEDAHVRRIEGQVYVDAPAMERLVGAIFERAGCGAQEAHRRAPASTSSWKCSAAR